MNISENNSPLLTKRERGISQRVVELLTSPGNNLSLDKISQEINYEPPPCKRELLGYLNNMVREGVLSCSLEKDPTYSLIKPAEQSGVRDN